MTKMDYFCFTKAQLRLLAMALSKLHDNSLRPTVWVAMAALTLQHGVILL